MRIQSDVLSVRFSPYNPNYVFGGTYTGQVLLWDTRNRHPNPALASPLSAVGHTHPIYSLDLVGSMHAHSLVSASMDGTVCSWATDGKFREPASIIDLHGPAGTKNEDISITSMGFPQGENNTFWVGTEEGRVYAALREAAGGRKAGLIQTEVYQGHNGPVTGLDFHPVAGAVDLSDLFLTCGVDWTVRLWQKGAGGGASAVAAVGGAAGASPAAAATKTKSSQIGHDPLLVFEEADDYIYDVKWHPHHPALFGSVDGAGKFNLWNMNEDTEVSSFASLGSALADLRSALAGPTHLDRGWHWTLTRSQQARLGPERRSTSRDRLLGRQGLRLRDQPGWVFSLASRFRLSLTVPCTTDIATPRENAWEEMRRTCNAPLAGESELGGR